LCKNIAASGLFVPHKHKACTTLAPFAGGSQRPVLVANRLAEGSFS